METIRVRERTVPGIGKLRELATEDGPTVSVVVRRSGGCDIGLRAPADDATAMTAALTDAEAVALAALLTGAAVFVDVEERDEPLD